MPVKNKKKYYAVKIGRISEIYAEWNEVKAKLVDLREQYSNRSA